MLNYEPPPLPDHIPEGTRFGTFTQRLGAAVLDLLVLAPLTYLAYYFTVDAPNLRVVIGLAVLEALYKPVTEKVFGYTVGKRVLKLRVVNQQDLGAISWNQTFIRYLPWAVVFFAGVFTTIRQFQDPNFGGFETYQDYLGYIRDSPLGQSSILAFLNNLPILSAIFIIGDALGRALHDRWAFTYVVHEG